MGHKDVSRFKGLLSSIIVAPLTGLGDPEPSIRLACRSWLRGCMRQQFFELEHEPKHERDLRRRLQRPFSLRFHRPREHVRHRLRGRQQ